MQLWVGALGALVAIVVVLGTGRVMTAWATGDDTRVPFWPTAITALLAGFVVGARIGPEPALAAFGVLAIAAGLLVGIDLRLHRLPDRLTLGLAATGIALLTIAAAVDHAWASVGRAIAGALVLFALYVLLFLVARSGLGAGDVKLAGALGIFLGWLGWSTLVVGAVAGVLVGGLVSLALLALRRATLATRVPYGPAMLAGALVAIAIGNAQAATILGW